MSMPNHLVLVRHGESEGNVAVHASKNGDNSHFTDEFVTTPGRLWNLTEKGRAQAACAGEFIQNLDLGASYSETRRHYVSPFTRTRQTAGHLGLVRAHYTDRPSVEWRINRSIRERDWGDIETIPRSEFNDSPLFVHNARKQQIDPLYWRPPGGESIADVAENRVRNFLDTLHRECSGYMVVAVTHGEFIRATRLVLERADDETYMDWHHDRDQKAANCEVFHYTRVVPEERFLGAFERPGDGRRTLWPSRDRLTFLRRAVPVEVSPGRWQMKVSQWQEIPFAFPTNAELLEAAAPKVSP